MEDKKMMFPEISGQNLEYQNFELPYTLKGELNLVIVPFKRWHQNLVDDWSFQLSALEKRYSKFKYYEVPTLSNGYRVMRFMIDGGMRSGIANKAVRERTITVYTNKAQFKKQLNIDSEDTIYLFLVNKTGDIIWKAEGKFNKNKMQILETILATHFNIKA